MKITVNGCVYRTENLSDALKQKPEFAKAIAKAEKRKAELDALKIPEIKVEKKSYKKQDED